MLTKFRATQASAINTTFITVIIIVTVITKGT